MALSRSMDEIFSDDQDGRGFLQLSGSLGFGSLKPQLKTSRTDSSRVTNLLTRNLLAIDGQDLLQTIRQSSLTSGLRLSGLREFQNSTSPHSLFPRVLSPGAHDRLTRVLLWIDGPQLLRLFRVSMFEL
jgi:hypothetical protein